MVRPKQPTSLTIKKYTPPRPVEEQLQEIIRQKQFRDALKLAGDHGWKIFTHKIGDERLESAWDILYWDILYKEWASKGRGLPKKLVKSGVTRNFVRYRVQIGLLLDTMRLFRYAADLKTIVNSTGSSPEDTFVGMVLIIDKFGEAISNFALIGFVNPFRPLTSMLLNRIYGYRYKYSRTILARIATLSDHEKSLIWKELPCDLRPCPSDLPDYHGANYICCNHRLPSWYTHKWNIYYRERHEDKLHRDRFSDY